MSNPWERTVEPILPYTLAETMDSGWAWQIEHEHHINRGYVYASQSVSDDQAADEFLRKNPKAPKSPRVVKFRSGCYRRQWVENVVAIGNSGGFVEPLEATALMVVCTHSKKIVDFLLHSSLSITPTLRDLYNESSLAGWEDIRDFLALHYLLNTALDSRFWKHCREDTDASTLAPLLKFYAENGPTGFCRYRLPKPTSSFSVEGFLVMLVGNRTSYNAQHTPTAVERSIWQAHRVSLSTKARSGIDVREALAYTRHPGWRWNDEQAIPATRA